MANTVVISPRPDTSISVRIAASKGSKWSYSWSSCSPRRLWRCPLGLHRKHSHCTACGCIVSSRAAPIAPPQTGTEQLSSTAHLACAERMSESIDSPVTSSTPVCTRWVGCTRLAPSSSRMPFCSRRNSALRPRGRHHHFRRLSLHGSTHNAVSSWPMAATECRAMLHCTEVHAMRLWLSE